jgi:hypothetical protein
LSNSKDAALLFAKLSAITTLAQQRYDGLQGFSGGRAQETPPDAPVPTKLNVPNFLAENAG